MAVHMRIVQENHLIANLPDWPHPIPRVGEFIFHPPSDPDRQHGIPGVAGYPGGIAGCVKTVTWRTHDRPADPDATSFVMTAHPYVELVI